MTDDDRTPPSQRESYPGIAVGGLILDFAYAYIRDRILSDELRLHQQGQSETAVHLTFGESILRHVQELPDEEALNEGEQS